MDTDIFCILRSQSKDSYFHSSYFFDQIFYSQRSSIPLDIRRHKRKFGPLHLLQQNVQGFIEFMIPYSNSIISHVIVSQDIGLCIRPIRNSLPGIDIPGIDQEHIRILLPHHPDKSSPLSHSPHTIHRQNATVTIIDIQEYDLILPVILINIQS